MDFMPLSQYQVYGIVTISLLFGCCIFLVSYKFVLNGMRLYQLTFVNKLDIGLKDAFIRMDAKTLFMIHVSMMILAAVLGFLWIGLIGMVMLVPLVAALPGFVMKIVRIKRADRFVYQLPDCLTAIASSLRAGTNLSRALEQVAEQQPAPISQEFSVVLSEYRMGKKLDDSLRDMYERIPRQEVELMNSAISISRSVGGNLADTLDTLAKTLREKAQIEGKIKALTAMGRMQGWVVGLMPVGVALMLFKQEPEGMKALIYEPVGWGVLGVLVALGILAVVMIRKIVNIDV